MISNCVKFAGLTLASLLLSIPYAEGKTIRVDQGPSNNLGNGNDGWNKCSSVTCASLAGLAVNPYGSNPTETPLPSGAIGGSKVSLDNASDPFVNASDPGSDLQAATGGTAPAVSYLYGTGNSQAQVVYFDLTSLTSIYTPSGGTVSNSGSAAWEVQLNYASANTTSSASLSFDGKTYVTDSAFDPLGFDEFVYAGNTLYVPTGWEAAGSTVSAPEIDPASSISGVTLLIGSLLVIRGCNRRRDQFEIVR